MKVFTFWEPRNKMPGYIRACLGTWRFIPNAEVVVLDYETIKDYLPEDLFRACTCRSMSLAMQSDAYRALLIERHGGVWLDADTVVLPQIVDSDILSGRAEVTMFSRFGGVGNGVAFPAGAFIHAIAPHAAFMRRWAEAIPDRVAEFARYSGNPFLRLLSRPRWRIVRKWNYCVNAIIDPLVEHMSEREFLLLDMDKYGVFPECTTLSECSNYEYACRYEQYYFSPGNAQETIKASSGLIMLHNSWTPADFRAMSEDEFLSSDVRLAALLRQVLGNTPASAQAT